MNVRQHAFLARALQDACGGPETCLKLLEPTPFRMSRTRFYACRDPEAGRTLPIGVVQFLEAQCQWKLYSASVAQQTPPPNDAACALSEACEGNEAFAHVQFLVRMAVARGGPTETDKREIECALQVVERQVQRVRAALDHGGAS